MKNLPLIIINHLKSHYKPTTKLNWNYYLTGLIQGCGEVSLIANLDKLGYIIKINLEIKDIMLIQTLREIIGLGKIHRYDNMALINYSIVEPKGLIKIYELTKNKFFLTNLNDLNNHNHLNTHNHMDHVLSTWSPDIKYYDLVEFYPRGMVENIPCSECSESTHFSNPNHYGPYRPTFIKPQVNTGSLISHYWVSGVLDANIRKGQMQLNLKALYLGMSEKENIRLNRTKQPGLSKYLMSQIMFEIDIINTSYLTLTKTNQIFGLYLVNINYFIGINIKIHPIDTHLRSYTNIDNFMSSTNYTSLENYEVAKLNQYLDETLKDGLPKGLSNKVLNYYKFNARKEMNGIFASHFKFSFPSGNLIKLLNHLDNYPLLSYKFTKFLKFRKIYRICQRKEHLHKSGILKILNLWECGREAK
jgi:hypothetical protein